MISPFNTTWSDSESMEYHLSQWQDVKQSTIAFRDFVANQMHASKDVLDLACGAGAATSYLANAFPDTRFLGLDLSMPLIEFANSQRNEFNLKNVAFCSGDWFNLNEDFRGRFDGVVSLQTLSWLQNAEEPLIEVFKKLEPQWFGISSLFFEGDISCTCLVNEHQRNRVTYYNVYSLKEVDRIAQRHGYRLTKYQKFEISMDLPKSDDINRMSTHTLIVHEGDTARRLQISGPLLMNWFFVMLEKSKSH